MPTIARALVDYDPDLLHVIADQWDIDLDVNNRALASDRLAEAMATTEAVDATWARLGVEERRALGDLLANEGRMPFAQFARRYGELRPMGPARREREKPWLEPASTTEALYYRGLIVRVFEQTPAGAQETAAIPSDLIDLLPQPAPEAIDHSPGHAVAPPHRLEEGYPTATDDMATLLAFLLLRDVNAREWLTREPSERIDRHLRHPNKPAYRALLVQLAYDLGLIRDEETLTHVVTRVDRDASRPWLEAPRTHQLRLLAEAWYNSTTWNDLLYTPGLEADEWPNNPLATRHALLKTMQNIPAEIWWSLDGLVEYMRQEEPDFQRPGGDYGAWYIHDSHSGEVMHGFQYWDHIEGALIRFAVEGPMHWLGLARAGRGVLLLTDLGLALQGRGEWPSTPDREARIRLDNQGLVSAPIELSRYERLQLSRFTAWISAPRPAPYRPGVEGRDEGMYVYRLTPQAIERAREDRMSITAHIIPFLQRLSGHALPSNVTTMLEAWDAAPREVIVHDVVIISAKDLGVYERLRDNRRVNRWLGQQIGPHSHIVKREDMPALLNALREMGLLPLFEGHEKDDWPL